ncbi:MAG TPA: zf-HC2 domain-containing protein [Candidatus Eremiobacteraceae bacterium]|nr:zf-HC2 domain-containing protein [Candidatus Eremiobacteraceae bacterium]
MTNCNDCRLLLVDYERGELDAARDAAMHQHLQSCSECRELWEADMSLVDSLRTWAAPREFPTSILANVRQAMYAEQPPTFMERLRAVLRPAYAAPVAAALVAVVIYSGYHRLNAPQPTLTGMDFIREHVAQTASLPSSDRAWSTYVLTSANTVSSSDASQSSP